MLVVNKTDAADEETLLGLKRLWPDAIFVSARTGAGLDALREAIEARLPQPAVELDVLVPYSRGDLVARVHEQGEVLDTAHTGEGTELRVRVDQTLAAELTPYLVTV
jgi:GTP-binding protein HflX